MKQKSTFKFDLVYTLRLLLYYAIAIIALMLSRVIGSVILSVIFCTVSIAYFTMLFSKIGIIALIPALLPIILIAFSESLTSALSALLIIVIAASFGLSVRKKLRPVEMVLITSAIFLIFSITLAIVEAIMQNGYFSAKESLDSILTLLDNTIAGVADTYKSATGQTINNIGYISSTLKSVIVGVMLSSYIAATGFYYALTMLIAKLTREADVYKGKRAFEIVPSKISAWVFIVCTIISLVFTASSTDVHFYTHLSTNILIVLSPVFIFAGIYYIVNIKYKVEHASPLFSIILLVGSLLSGFVHIIPLYIAFSGISYTLKQNINNTTDDSL